MRWKAPPWRRAQSSSSWSETLAAAPISTARWARPREAPPAELRYKRHMSAEAAYLHGTSPAEQGRLSLLNRLMNEAAMRELAIRPGERIVDFGSGLGQLSLDMARAAGVGAVGIERSEEQLARAERDPLLDLRRGDVTNPPLREREWGSFDLAHARFVLEHVLDPLTVVRHMVRAVRDRKSTRLNSSHLVISYAVFCLKKKKKTLILCLLKKKKKKKTKHK